MRKKTKTMNCAVMTLTMLFYVVLITLSAKVEAKSKVIAIEGMSYSINASLVDNLKSHIGKKMSVTLDSGKTFTGFVKNVGNHLVHLEKLDGKEFFDALIRIENISAIDTRFRNIQR